MTAIVNNSTDVTRLPGGRRRVRTYAGRRYWRTAGRWRTIDDDLDVEAGDDGSYTVRLGDAAIRLAPAGHADRKALTGATKRRATNKRRFGPVLDAKHLPKALRFELVTEGDVVETPAGPAFGADDDRALGCFFRKWTRRLGGRMSVDHPGRGPRMILLDLDGLFDEGVGSDGELDLDPETVAPTQTTYEYFLELSEPTATAAWDNAHDAASATGRSLDTVAQVRASLSDSNGTGTPPWHARIDRTGFRFDTSAYPAEDVTSCLLKLTADPFLPAGVTPHLSVVSQWSNNNVAMAAYGDMRVYGYEVPANRVGDMADVGDNIVAGPDMVASGHYAATAEFDLAVCERHDVADDPPTLDHGSYMAIFDATATHLEIVLAGSAATPIHALATQPIGGLC